MIKHLILKNDIAEIKRLADAVLEFGKEANLSKETTGNIRLVLEEIVTNIVLYGCEDNAGHLIDVCINYKDEEIAIEVKDDAKPFNPLEVPNADLEKPFEERKIGGLGIHLVRRLIDDIEYRSEEGKNILLMKKHRKKHP